MKTLGNRMKENYEDPYRIKLPKRMPVIIRLDGKAFHTLTRQCYTEKPFDNFFIGLMNRTALALMKDISGARVAYVQSDEISILINNYANFDTEAWFDNNLQKMVSVSAGIASSHFSLMGGRSVTFDARAFVLPKEEVNNYFIWRQQDWERNSLQMLARTLYSHRELHGKGKAELHEMCFQKGQNWNDLPVSYKRGRCILSNNIIDNTPPIFKDDPDYIGVHLLENERDEVLVPSVV